MGDNIGRIDIGAFTWNMILFDRRDWLVLAGVGVKINEHISGFIRSNLACWWEPCLSYPCTTQLYTLISPCPSVCLFVSLSVCPSVSTFVCDSEAWFVIYHKHFIFGMGTAPREKCRVWYYILFLIECMHNGLICDLNAGVIYYPRTCLVSLSNRRNTKIWIR